MTPLSVMVDGVPFPTTPFDHPHGRSEDLFLLVRTPTPVPPGTEIAWMGDMPEDKTNLWVRISCTVGGFGTFRLREEDLQKTNLGFLKPAPERGSHEIQPRHQQKTSS